MMRVLVVPYHRGILDVADHQIRVSPDVLSLVLFVMKSNPLPARTRRIPHVNERISSTDLC